MSNVNGIYKQQQIKIKYLLGKRGKQMTVSYEAGKKSKKLDSFFVEEKEQ